VVAVADVAGTSARTRPVEPVNLGGRRQVPDTVADGGARGPLVVRAGSVRGDTARGHGDLRRDAFLLGVVADELPADLTSVLAVVASGPRIADGIGHFLAGLACDTMQLALRGSSKEIGRAWAGNDRADLAARFADAGQQVERTVAAEAGGRYDVDLSVLLAQAGDRTAPRRVLACHYGSGRLLVGRGREWSHPKGAGRQPLVELLETRPGDLVVLATAATADVLERDAAFFLDGLHGPREQAEFAWLLSARTGDNSEDRTAVCLWDQGTVAGPAPWAPRPSR
jgi:hypothetical protein